MRDGFIKCAAGTPRVSVANCEYNSDRIIELMTEASEKGVKLLVLPELCITGYTCGDLFFQRTLLKSAERALNKVVFASTGLNMITIVGFPFVRSNVMYNCAAVVYQGSILGIVPKVNIPNYKEFYEARYFTTPDSANTTVSISGEVIPFGRSLVFSCAGMPEFSFAIEICEDLWVLNPVSSSHASAGATIVANLSASNEAVGKDDSRRELVQNHSRRLMCGYVYASAGEGESTTDVVFSGHNIISENGRIHAESKLFANEMVISDIDVFRLADQRVGISTFMESFDGYTRIQFDMPVVETELVRKFKKHPFVPSKAEARAQRCESILSIQAAGLKQRISHTGAKALVIGVSGGLDSTLAMLVAARALDLLGRSRSEIYAVTMPCFGTTSRTRSNAELLSKELGATFMEVDITDSVLQHFNDIDHSPDNYNVVYENTQARERTQVLMDLANKYNGLVIGTGDMSELALGWATYNGDHMSMYAVNASVPKTLIRHIVKYMAESTELPGLSTVLYDIVGTPVSPELLPAVDGKISQKTEGIVGPYELHDFFLYYMIRWGYSPSKVLRIAQIAFEGAYTNSEILKWLEIFVRRFFSQQFKRSCIPDGPKVGSVALSPRGDWRMPSDASAAIWLEEINELKGKGGV